MGIFRAIDDSPTEIFVTKPLSYLAQLIQQAREKQLTSNGKQCEVPVSEMPNLFLVVYALGASLVYRYKDPITKKWTSITIGDAATMPLAEAINRATAVRDAVAAGNSPRQSVLTVAAYFDDYYCPRAVSNNKRSIADDRSRFNCHVRAPLGNHLMATLRLYHLKNVIDQLPAHLSSGTKDRVAALLKTLCKNAVDDGLMEINPAARLKLRNAENARQRIATPAEIRALCGPQDGKGLSLLHLLIRLLFATSMRYSEAVTAKHSYVDLDGRFLHLPMTKNGKPRSVPLSEESLAVIQALTAIRTNEYLFPGRSGGHMSRPTHAFNRLKKEAGIEGLCFHDMRRTSCSIALNGGVPLLDASRLLGHSNTTVTQNHYAVLHADRLHAASALISDVLRAAMGTATK